MSTSEVFLSENNIDFLYKNVSNQVLQSTNYNLNSSSKYKKTFKGMMEKVYENSEIQVKKNLASLNNITVTKITKYFIEQVSQKNKNNPIITMQGMQGVGPVAGTLMDRPMRAIQGTSSETLINSRFDAIQHERRSLNEMQNPPTMNGIESISIQELETSKSETNKKFKDLLAMRGEILPNTPETPDKSNNQNKSTKQNTQNTQNTQNKKKQLIIQQQPQKQKKQQLQPNQEDEFNIMPFTISDDFSNQASENGQPLYINNDQLNDNSPEQIGNRYENLQKLRNQEIGDFLNFQNNKDVQKLNKISNDANNIFSAPMEPRKQYNVEEFNNLDDNQTLGLYEQDNQNGDLNFQTDKVVSDYLGERSSIDHINNIRNPIDISRTKIYSSAMEPQGKSSSQLRMATNQKHEHEAIMEEGNPIYDFLMKQLKFSERKYQDVPYYFVVSSEDRNWVNNIENRYNFLVNFRPSDTYSGIGIDHIYKNVVSVEVIKVVFPHDRLSVPFDNRIYLDLQSYPFLVMDIDELDGVFRGSNNTINDAFALLLFDKAYDSEVLTADQLKLSNPDQTIPLAPLLKKFDRQFKRGFMAFCPFLFEKKKYPNTPIASINRMSIKFYRPDGQLISVDQDRLEISSIASNTLANLSLELSDTTGFPGILGENLRYIEITTKTFFSNRTFRIGDLIKIRNCKLKSTTTDQAIIKMVEYINRPEGHIIVNLESELSTQGATNEGYINKLYISPMGEIDYGAANVANLTINYNHTTPGLNDMLVVDGDPSWGVLINSSMQVHITFKIMSREDKTDAVIAPFNV